MMKKIFDVISSFLDSVYIYVLYTVFGLIYGPLSIYYSLFFLTFESYTYDGCGYNDGIKFDMAGLELLVIGTYLLGLGIYSLVKVIKYFKNK